MAHFMPPQIQDNPDGWGPCAVPQQFKDIPYQPFSKGDRIGKVADWTGTAYQDRKYTSKYQSQFGAGTQYAYYHEGDDSSFQLVDTSKPHKTAYQRNKQRFNNARLKREREKQQRKEAIMMGQPQNKGKMKGNKLQRNWHRHRYNDRQNNQKHRNASVAIREDWKVLEDMDFPRLGKLKLPDIPEPTDLYSAGTMEYYDKSFDRITARNEIPLDGNNRIFHKVTTTDDPVIRKLTSKGNVFGTDAIISTLMTSTRSVHSWDVIVQRVGNKLFFDKRDDSEFDLLTVYETAWEPPPEEGINSASNLALEATFINQNFSQQCLRKGDKLAFDNPNPFVEDEAEAVASVGYRYRKYELGDGINLIVRCEHDALTHGASGENLYLNIKTLNEWDSKVSGVAWRAKLDSQGGSVLATELKNNSCKLAKWTCSAILAGSEYLKLGYVSRVTAGDSSKHVILGTQQFKPKEFADQIALNMDNGWGILRVIIDTCMKLPEGKYLILKDPNKGIIRLYDIPDNTFESEDDSSDDESEEEEGENEEEEKKKE